MYSLLDGAIRINPLLETVKSMGMPAVAMTDHGNMFGAVEFFKACRGNDVKPIIGVEFNVCAQRAQGSSHHLTVLAENDEGYRNLMRLNSFSSLHGTHRDLPHVDHEMLGQHHEGLIALSGDLGGEIPQAILRGDLDEATRLAHLYRDLFGVDNFFLEVMDNDFPEQARVNEGRIDISRANHIPLVATNDCHYLTRDEALAHAILMCIQLQKSVDLERIRDLVVDSFYFKSPDEMWEAFSDTPEACQNTLAIAERINVTIPLGEVFLPQYKVPQIFNPEHTVSDPAAGIALYFVDRSRAGLQERVK